MGLFSWAFVKRIMCILYFIICVGLFHVKRQPNWQIQCYYVFHMIQELVYIFLSLSLHLVWMQTKSRLCDPYINIHVFFFSCYLLESFRWRGLRSTWDDLIDSDLDCYGYEHHFWNEYSIVYDLIVKYVVKMIPSLSRRMTFGVVERLESTKPLGV